MNTKDSIIDQFSPHLFWDTDKENINMNSHRAYIIKRVLEYGQLNDWKLIRTYYSLPVIVQVVKTLRELNPQALSYIAAISNTPIESFRCYTSKQSPHPHWNF